jgi:hypothetical protein
MAMASPTTTAGGHEIDIPSLEAPGACRQDRGDGQKAEGHNECDKRLHGVRTRAAISMRQPDPRPSLQTAVEELSKK